MPAARRIAIALEIDKPFPHHQQVFDGIQRFAKAHSDWNCIIDEHPGLYRRRRGADYGNYDGVIARATLEMQQRINRLGIPLVNTHYQYHRRGLAGVYADPKELGRMAAAHLLERGFRRLIALGDTTHMHCKHVNQAFQQHAEDLGASCELFELSVSGYEDARNWIKMATFIEKLVQKLQPPAAFFVETSPTARMIIQYCSARGMHVPQEVAVLCQQYLKAVVEVSPQISSIEPNYERVGHDAARLLAAMLTGKPAPDEPTLLPTGRIDARESTDYYAVEDELVAKALQFISTNLRADLRTEEIAYELAVSPRQLQMRFDQALGRGVGEEIRRLRLEAVKRLLLDPQQRIADIADRTGFGRPQLLNAVFRRELGMSPREFRQKQK